MSALVKYWVGGVAIDGPPVEVGTQVEVRLVATVQEQHGHLKLRIDDWAGPMECAPVVICGRLLVGQGSDVADPLCTRPTGHLGRCKP